MYMSETIWENTKLKDYGKESVLEFIKTKIKQNNNVKKDILEEIRYVSDEVTDGTIVEDRSSQGFYYERIWDLCIKFGVTDLTLPSMNEHLQTSHIINENPNKSDIQFQKNCWDGNKLNKNPGGYLLQPVRSGNSGGYSDITFINKFIDDKEELYFISVKYFTEEKEISKYDIGKLCSLIREHEKENRIIKLYIFVKDKKKAIAKFSSQHTSSNILIKYINPGGKYENIYDIHDLQHFYFKLKKLLEEYNYLQTTDNIEDFQKKYLNVLKHIFIPRFHQQLFILKINKLIEDGEKNILVGAIPRSGKSYIMAGTILDYVKKNEVLFPGKKLKFLMMTPAPNETFGEYENIFNNYIEFDKLGIDIITYKGEVNLKNLCKNKNRHCVIIISKQKLGWSSGSDAEKLLDEDNIGSEEPEEEEKEEETQEEEEDEETQEEETQGGETKRKRGGGEEDEEEEKVVGAEEEDEEEDDQEEEEEEEDDPEEEEDDQEEEEEEQEGGAIKTKAVTEEDTEIKTIKSRITKLLGKNSDINVMFLDEAHFGMSTEKAKKIVDVLNSVIVNTVKIYVTATYNKPLQTYGVKPDCKLTWDMNDIKIMQNLTIENINDNLVKKQFGSSIYTKTLEYYGDKTGETLVDKLKMEYAIYPKPYLITSLWDKEFLNTEKLKIGDTEFGWDMNKLFTTTGESDVFANEEQIKEMMRYYFGYPNKEEGYDKQSFYRTRGILPRIKNICLNNCRTLQQNHKTTQLWFLPLGNGKIKNKIKALVYLLTNSNEFKDIQKNYHFFVAVDIEDKTKKGRTVDGVTYMNNPREIKKEIEDIEKEIKEGKLKSDNLIILAGQRLQLGISLRNVDIVTLWNSISSSDAIFQMLFRSMTEVETSPCIPDEYCPQKKYGFMVDMNPQRALTNVNLFSENMTKKTNDDIQKYRQITDLINIDTDVLYDKYGDSEAQKDKYVADLFNKLYASWNINVDNIKKIINKFTFDMTKLELLKDDFENINMDKKTNKKDEIDQKEEDEVFEPGKKKEKISPKQKKKEKIETEINLNEIATELISEFISLLNIFTLYSDKGAKCILTDNSKTNAQITVIDDIDILKNEIYKDVEQKNMFLKMLNGRLSGNLDVAYPEKIIDNVLDAMNNMGDKQILNKIIISQKKQYYTIHEPDKLLEFINGELKPKQKEKKENGEVFTPLSFVNEMLDKLEEVYTKEHGKSIFSEPTLKWLDPAVGIGNFPIIIYQRLMEGLKSIIKEEEKRRKHILENMIYMSELTPKNVFVCSKILCSNTYKLNIHEGDTLMMDMIKEFALPSDFTGFDVILGNPPYQKQVGPKNTEIIWNKFIIKSLSILKSEGYLVYVHPSGWRNISGDVKNIQKEILSRNLQYLEIHNEKDGLKIFSSETRYDWYILQNKKVDVTNTIIKFQDGTIKTMNVNDLEFIPNGEYDKIMSMIAKPGEDRIELLHSYSLYETRKSWMSKIRTEVYKYPCVYTVDSKSELKLKYSSTDRGHFGIPKFIWSNGRISSIGSYVDINGDYGLTQFAYAIVDNPENLPKIKEVFDTKEFRKLMELCAVGQLTVNHKVIALFKKDFWKTFASLRSSNTQSKSANNSISEGGSIRKEEPISISIVKKKRTLKNRKKKIENNIPLQKRYVKDKTENKRKMERNTIKREGKLKKTFRKKKHKKTNKRKTIKHKHK